MSTLNDNLNAMKSSRVVDGKLEKLVYGLTLQRMNQRIQESIERGWKPIGETKIVGQYHVHKMIFEGDRNHEPNKAF